MMLKRQEKTTRGKTAAALQMHTVQRAIELGLSNSREIGDELTRKALLWCYRWGWSAPSTLDYLTHQGRCGKAARLQQRELLQAGRVGNWSPDVPRKLLTLTDSGFIELCRLHDSVSCDLQDTKIRYNQLLHDYVVQNLALQLSDSAGLRYFSGPEIAILGARHNWKKLPDAIVDNCAIELELTPKKEQEIWLACDGLIDLYLAGKIKSISIYSTQKPILRKYAERLQRGKRLKRYLLAANNKTWYADGWTEKMDFDPPVRYYRIDTRPDFSKKDLTRTHEIYHCSEMMPKELLSAAKPATVANPQRLRQRLQYEENPDE